MSEEKSVRNLNLYDPTLLKRVVGTSTDAMEVILNAILDTTIQQSDFEVLEVLTRKIENEGYDDVMQYIAFARDSAGEDYEIEVQVIEGEDAYNRSMWYLFNMFNNRMKLRFSGFCMPKSFIIILNKEDMVGGNEPYYISEMRGKNAVTNEEIDFETEEVLGLKHCFPPCIFVNGEQKDEHTSLGRLLLDFEETDPDQLIFPALAESVRAAKESLIE